MKERLKALGLLPGRKSCLVVNNENPYHWLICHATETYIKPLMKDLWNGTHFHFARIPADRGPPRSSTISWHAAEVFTGLLVANKLLSEMKVQLQPYETECPD